MNSRLGKQIYIAPKKKKKKKMSSTVRCSFKQMFLKNFTKLTGNTCARVSFLIKLQALGLKLYLKKGSGTGVFLLILRKF